MRAKLNHSLLSFAEHHLNTITQTVTVKVDGDGLLVIFGDITALAKIASRLAGALQVAASKHKCTNLNLRMGASFGRLELVAGVNGETDANGDAINRAVRLQSANTEARELWCDHAAVEALIRSESPLTVKVIGNKKVRDFGDQIVYAVTEEGVSSSLFRALTCFHQGLSIQYWYLASRLHRTFKESFNGNRPAAHEEKAAMLDFLRTNFQQVALGTFDYIRKYFEPRATAVGGTQTRICIKGFDEERRVIDLVRESGVAHSAPVYEHQNSGFDHLVKTGSPYLANDLLTELENYTNPRLDRDQVLRLNNRLKDRGASHVVDRQDWRKCWHDGDKFPGNCYRSTLIVPLTLKNNHGLLPEFQGVFGGGIDDERLIYGALCFDHVEPQFFRQEDIDFAYVAADWLSFYLLIQINFTTKSDTFRKSAG